MELNITKSGQRCSNVNCTGVATRLITMGDEESKLCTNCFSEYFYNNTQRIREEPVDILIKNIEVTKCQECDDPAKFHLSEIEIEGGLCNTHFLSFFEEKA